MMMVDVERLDERVRKLVEAFRHGRQGHRADPRFEREGHPARPRDRHDRAFCSEARAAPGSALR